MMRQGLSNFLLLVIILAVIISGVKIVNANKYVSMYSDALSVKNTRALALYENKEETEINDYFNNRISDYLISHLTSKELVVLEDTKAKLLSSITQFRADHIKIDVIEVDENTKKARIYVSKTKLFSEILHTLNISVSSSDENYSSKFIDSIINSLNNTSNTGRYEMTIKINYDKANKTYSIDDEELDKILAIVTGL